MEHKGQRGQLQGNPVRGQFDFTNPAHHDRAGAEQCAFGQLRQTNRQADPAHLMEGFPIGFPQALIQVVVRALDLRVDRQNQQGNKVANDRGQGRPRQAQFRKAPVSEYQRIVDDRVQHDANQRHDQQNCRQL